MPIWVGLYARWQSERLPWGNWVVSDIMSSLVFVRGHSVALWSMNGCRSFPSIMVFNDLPRYMDGWDMGRNGLIMNVLLDDGYSVNMWGRASSMNSNHTNFIDETKS
jgi:hypothetical protein